MKVYHSTSDGRYNLMSNERQSQVFLHTPAGNFFETWPLGEAPYHSDMLPSEVLDIIEQRLDSYMFSSRREQDKERIAKCREQIREFDIAWVRAKVERAKNELAEWEAVLNDLTKQVDGTDQNANRGTAT